MTNSPNNPIGSDQNGRTPSDEQMDHLLKGFFRMEVPVELNRPFQRASVRMEPSVVISTRESVFVSTLNRGPKVIVATALSLLVLSLVVFVQVSKEDAGGIAKKGSEKKEDLMLVSPNANSKASQPLTEDGVTLEETESIELKARQK